MEHQPRDDSITPELNYRFVQFMEQPLNLIVQNYFSKQRWPQLNKSISTNFYALDAIGIPIRRNEEGKTTIFGWKRIGDCFYHHMVNEQLINNINADDLRVKTISDIRLQFKSSFIKTTPMKRLLLMLYPELFA